MPNSRYEDIKEYLRIKALIDGDRSDKIIKQAHKEAIKKAEEKRKSGKNQGEKDR